LAKNATRARFGIDAGRLLDALEHRARREQIALFECVEGGVFAPGRVAEAVVTRCRLDDGRARRRAERFGHGLLGDAEPRVRQPHLRLQERVGLRREGLPHAERRLADAQGVERVDGWRFGGLLVHLVRLPMRGGGALRSGGRFHFSSDPQVLP
jgi:hypothetical protein